MQKEMLASGGLVEREYDTDLVNTTISADCIRSLRNTCVFQSVISREIFCGGNRHLFGAVTFDLQGTRDREVVSSTRNMNDLRLFVAHGCCHQQAGGRGCEPRTT